MRGIRFKFEQTDITVRLVPTAHGITKTSLIAESVVKPRRHAIVDDPHQHIHGRFTWVVMAWTTKTERQTGLAGSRLVYVIEARRLLSEGQSGDEDISLRNVSKCALDV